MRINVTRCIVASAAAMVIGGLGGCAAAPEVASLESGSVALPEDGNQAQRLGAEALYACLVDLNLPAVMMEKGDGQVTVVWEQKAVSEVLWTAPDGNHGAMLGDDVDDPYSVIQPFFDAHSGTYALTIDGADYSEDWRICYEASGYSRPSSFEDPRVELRNKEALSEASNKWAQCARENGYPDLADADVPVADDYTTHPIVILPATITVEQVQVLVAACPIIDPTGPKPESMEDLFGLIPGIGFDTPWFDGRPLMRELTREEMEKYYELTMALYDELAPLEVGELSGTPYTPYW